MRIIKKFRTIIRYTSTKTKQENESAEGFPTLKKYAPILIPLVTVFSSTIWLINDCDFRNFVEKYAAFYGDLILLL